MDAAAVEKILKDVRFIQALGPEALKLSRVARHITQKSGSILFTQLDQPDNCYVVVSGQVGVFIDRKYAPRNLPSELDSPEGLRPGGYLTLEISSRPGSRPGSRGSSRQGSKQSARKPSKNADLGEAAVTPKLLRTLTKMPSNFDSNKNAKYGQQVSTLGPGDMFGELAMINKQCRTATAICLTDCQLLVIDGKSFEQVIDKTQLLRNTEFFKDLGEEVFSKVAKVAEFVSHQAKETLFYQGDPPDSCYIIWFGRAGVFVNKSGVLVTVGSRADLDSSNNDTSGQQGDIRISLRGAGQLVNIGDQVTVLGSGSLFGELALMNDQPRAATVKCLSDCTFLKISKSSFEDILKEEMLRFADGKTRFLMKHLPGLAKLPPSRSPTTPHPSYFFKLVSYPKDHVFIGPGASKEDFICVIEQGSVDLARAVDKDKECAAFIKGKELLQVNSRAKSKSCSRLPKLTSAAHLQGSHAMHHAGTLITGASFASKVGTSSAEPFSVIASSSPCEVLEVRGVDLEQLPPRLVSMIQEFITTANMWRLKSHESNYTRRLYDQLMMNYNAKPRVNLRTGKVKQAIMLS